MQLLPREVTVEGNPVVPTQLIVDHSLAVEHAGFEKDAFEKNRAIEDRRNDDRFTSSNWTKTAFENVDVIPPATASCIKSTWSVCLPLFTPETA